MIKIVNLRVAIKWKKPIYFSFMVDGILHQGKLIKEDDSLYFLCNSEEIKGGMPENIKLMEKYKSSWWCGVLTKNGYADVCLPPQGEEYKILSDKKWRLSLVYKK
jgi:hypothetical protein